MTTEFDDDDFMEPDPPFRKRSTPVDPEELLRVKAERLDLAKITRKVLEDRMREQIDSLVKERIEAEIDAVLTEGWVATNQWGEPERARDERVSVRDRIASYLSGKNRYDSRPRMTDMIHTKIERAVEHQVKQAVSDFKKELADFKREKMTEKLRAVLDGDIFR